MTYFEGTVVARAKQNGLRTLWLQLPCFVLKMSSITNSHFKSFRDFIVFIALH